MKKIKITTIFGTRPEAIKMCPLILELHKRPEIELRVVLSGQHRQMCREVTEYFGVIPDGDLDVMRDGQSLSELTKRILSGVTEELSKHYAHILLVHGDTTTALAASIGAFYTGIRVGHVEAGLRTNDPFSPYPEEFNRRAVDAISYCHFAPTEKAVQNLLREGISQNRIFLTGNTVVDSLAYTLTDLPKKDKNAPPLLLVTLHRRESRGDGMKRILRAVHRMAMDRRDLRIVLPAHPSPEVRQAIRDVLTGELPNLEVCDPLPLPKFHKLLYLSDLILTDSGGIQEEAVSLGKRLILARDTTERPEGIESGYVTLVGRDEEAIFRAIYDNISNPTKDQRPTTLNPFGDGNASKKIADILSSLPLEKVSAI